MHAGFSLSNTGQSKPVMKDELHLVPFRQNNWPLALFLLFHIVDTVSWSDPYLVGLLSVRFKCLWHQRPRDLLDVSEPLEWDGVSRDHLAEESLYCRSALFADKIVLVWWNHVVSRKMDTCFFLCIYNKKFTSFKCLVQKDYGTELWNQVSSSIISCLSHSGNYFFPVPHLLEAK